MISGTVGPGDRERGTTSIWLVSILGGAPRKLRDGAYRANLSPDDSLVAYMGMKGGIWLADADGENPREFIGAEQWEFLGSPDWSSDGKRVVYRRVGPSKTGMQAQQTQLDVIANNMANMETVGFNIEWSQELLVGESLVFNAAALRPFGEYFATGLT